MKRICLIAPKLLPIPSVLGGAIEQLITTLIEQNEIEKKAEFLVYSIENEEAAKKAAAYQNTKIIYVPKDNIPDKIENRIRRYTGMMVDEGYYRKVFGLLKKEKVDAIVAESGNYIELRKFQKYFGKENMYLHIHHQSIATEKIAGIFGNLISVSEFIESQWVRDGYDMDAKKHIVLNCVDENRFNQAISAEERLQMREKFGFKDNDVVLLYCGRIVQEKGIRELLEAVKKCDEKHIKVLLIGSSDFGLKSRTPYVEEMEKLVESMGERVRFTGYVENRELFRYYQCADIQIVPSLCEEAAGLVAIEGMLSGLPLIVTRSGGLVEYVSADCAVILEKENLTDDLSDAIRALAGDEERRNRMAKASKAYAARFKKSEFYNQFIDVFEDR